MTRERVSLLLLASLLWMAVSAQEAKPLSLRLEARGEYVCDAVDGTRQQEGSGFKGTIANVLLQGRLSPRFSYKYRQRLNGINRDHTFFDATDWLYLRYDMTPAVGFVAGKWVVLTGGWELDPAPIDVYDVSEFCYHFACYQWGGALAVTTGSRNDQWYAQVCESPYRKQYEQRTGTAADLYAFNLVWYGHHGAYHAAWSANMMEYAPGRYINYLYLGNRLTLGSHLAIDLDVMNRATHGQPFLFRDCSLAGQLRYTFSPAVNVFAKATYDVNRTGHARDQSLGDGTEITRIGAGVEYFPMGNYKVRLHAHYSYAFGRNTTPCAVIHDKQSTLRVGLTWRMDVL